MKLWLQGNVFLSYFASYRSIRFDSLIRTFCKVILQQFRVIRDHLNLKCLTSLIVFDILSAVAHSIASQITIRQIRIRSTQIFHIN